MRGGSQTLHLLTDLSSSLKNIIASISVPTDSSASNTGISDPAALVGSAVDASAQSLHSNNAANVVGHSLDQTNILTYCLYCHLLKTICLNWIKKRIDLRKMTEKSLLLSLFLIGFRLSRFFSSILCEKFPTRSTGLFQHMNNWTLYLKLIVILVVILGLIMMRHSDIN